MTKKKNISITVLVILGLIFAAGYFSYHPPLIDSGSRNPLEWPIDFFSFGWHFSRQAWMNRSRDWPSASRERLLAFWYRPGYHDYEDLKEKSLMELAREYGRASLNSRAAELYLLAHREDMGNQWLARKVGDKLCKLKDWDKLEIVARDILKYHPEDEEGSLWLKMAEKKRIDR